MSQTKDFFGIIKGLLALAPADTGPGLSRALLQIAEGLGGTKAWLISDAFTAASGAPLPKGAAETLTTAWDATLRAGEPVILTTPDSAPTMEATELLAFLGLGPGLLLPVLRQGQIAGLFLTGTAPGTAPPDDLPELADVLLTLLDRAASIASTAQAESQLKATLSVLPELMFEMSADGHYGDFIVGPKHLMLRPPEAMAGAHLSEVMPPDLVATMQKALDDTINRGRVSNVVYGVDLPFGRRIFNLSGARKERGPGLSPTAVFLVRDITHSQIMQEELLRLGSVIKAMSNLVAIVDTNLCITWVNASFERQTGWRLEDIRGKLLSELVRAPESDPAVAAALNEALAEARPFSGQNVNQDRHGNRYWVDFNVVPIRDSAGRLQGFVTVETLVTRLKDQQAATAAMARTAAAAHSRLDNALRALPDCVMVFDNAEKLVVSNPAFATAFPQVAPLALPGTSLTDLMQAGLASGLLGPIPEAPDQLQSQLEEQLELFRRDHYATELQLPDGRWVRRVNNRTDDGGIIAIILDITTKRNQLEALDQANRELTRALAERDLVRQRLVNIMDGAQVGTWELDIPRGELTVGGQWSHIIGQEDQGMTVLPTEVFRSLVHPEDRPLLESGTMQAEGPGPQFIEYEFRMRHRNGDWVWVLSRGRVTMRDHQGNALLVVGVHLDISERKRLEREIKESENYLTQALESSVAAIMLYDHEDRVAYCNPEAQRVLQLEPGPSRAPLVPLEGGWELQTLDGEPLPADRTPLALARAAGGTIRDLRIAVRWPDGTRRVLTSNAAPLDVGEGRVNVVVSFQDITDELAATERLEQALAHAEEMSRAKSVFLANMSHEIRTPLNGVLGLAEVLAMQLHDPEQKRMIDTIRASGETLLTVLNSILDMSKIEAGKMQLESVPVSMQEIVTQIDALYTVQAEEKGIEFEVLASSGCEIPRLGDPHRIQQILHNLLNNAIKFTSEGGVTLRISCRPGRPVVFEVEDTGTGMTPEQSARVFESFEQADGSMTRRFGGTGLGLSIVRQLVLLMGGQISLDSELGQGTTIRVSLPLPETVIAAPRALAREQTEADFSGLTILAADDNATNREVLFQMLSPSGAQIEQVENGQLAYQAWAAAHKAGRPYDIILLDITMPVQDGPTTLTEIRRSEAEQGLPPIPAVAVTANAMPEQVAEYVMAGFDTHLAKPFAKREVIHAVASLLQERKLNLPG